MTTMGRRRMLLGIGAVAAAALAGPRATDGARAWAAEQPFTPEKGARLRLLCWQPLLRAGAAAFERQIAAFTAATGVPVEVSYASTLDVTVKATWAAARNSGPDLVWTTHGDAHLFPEKLVDISDVAKHLGDKLGGWYPIAKEYGIHDGRWISLPIALNGNNMVYRTSWLQQAGFDAFPTDLDGFMRLAKRLKTSHHPMGMALGDSTTDGNCWTHWLLWAFGGAVFDGNNRATINSPQTLQALEYLRELHPHFIDGTLGWQDRSNNDAFAAGEIGCTSNSIAIYGELVNAHDPMAADTEHAIFPIGPIGRSAEFHTMRPMHLYAYSRFPRAAKALMVFLLERPHFDEWLQQVGGYLSHTLKAHGSHPVWTADPKITPFRDAALRCRSFAYNGKLGHAASAILSDQIVRMMFADVAAGRQTPKNATIRAERQAMRYLGA